MNETDHQELKIETFEETQPQTRQQTLKEELKIKVLTFGTKLYSTPVVNRSLIQYVFNIIAILFKDVFSILSGKINLLGALDGNISNNEHFKDIISILPDELFLSTALSTNASNY